MKCQESQGGLDWSLEEKTELWEGEGAEGRQAVYLAETMTASASSQRSWGSRWSVFLERRKSPGNTTPPATMGVSMVAQASGRKPGSSRERAGRPS